MDARAIVDTGFLLALRDRTDSHHPWATALARQVRGPWITCEGCVSEMVFLFAERLGPPAVLELYRQIERRLILSRHFLPEDLEKVADETARYRDRVVDFADACLMVLSDQFPRLPIVTTDVADFTVYLRGRSVRRLLAPNNEGGK